MAHIGVNIDFCIFVVIFGKITNLLIKPVLKSERIA